jgi:dATP/dGTP diphosphohydrolase, N-terminal
VSWSDDGPNDDNHLQDLADGARADWLEEEANAAIHADAKPSNPKDIIGGKKLDMGLVPDTLVVFAAEGFLEGASKYGRYNWRIAGVAASIYHGAIKRHLAKWWNGQNCDKATRVRHLASIISCAGILLDAELCGKFKDDRPPCPDPDAMADLIDQAEAQVAHLKELFKDHHPYQFTIADTPSK